MSLPFVFLIHAGADKPRLVPIVRALIDGGVRLWIDEPHTERLGLNSAQIAMLEGFPDPGKDWETNRNEAMRRASAFLIVVSEIALSRSRSQVEAELAIARYNELDAEVPVFPLPLSQAELEAGAALIGKRQGFKTFVEHGPDGYALNARGEIELQRLLDRLRGLSPRRQLPAHGPRDSGHDIEMLPYFANRDGQALDILNALRQRRSVGGALALPVLVGMRHDAPDQFITTQLPGRVVPRFAQHNECGAVRLRIPSVCETSYEAALAKLLGEISDARPFLRAMVVFAQPAPRDLEHPDGLRLWLSLWADAWSQIAHEVSAHLLVPILDIRADFLRPSAFARLRLGSSPRRRVIDACSAINSDHDAVELLPLTPLGHVTWGCVETWLRDELEANLGRTDAITVRRALEQIVPTRGLAMNDWADVARTQIRSAVASRDNFSA